ncbi:MAG: hypothetical protein Ct9H300mP18_11700 [Candidatus Neomarinimicrobiota bacterium]|nr:MAG: hypothetical protein Ct9H300mP18_11700 [Candidatus Neomarinimicrobiota bacterium]
MNLDFLIISNPNNKDELSKIKTEGEISDEMGKKLEKSIKDFLKGFLPKMANLKDIRDRIKSVKSIQKVTKAMKMVAAAKMRRAQGKKWNRQGLTPIV